MISYIHSNNVYRVLVQLMTADATTFLFDLLLGLDFVKFGEFLLLRLLSLHRVVLG